MKLSKKIIKILTITSIISLFPINYYEAITKDESFTYEDGLWKPGKVESKDFYINNSKENDITVDRLYIALKLSGHWKTGDELDTNSYRFKEFSKYTTVTLKHGNDVLFKDSFENLLSEKGIKLSKDIDIKSNSRELFNMTIEMDLEKNNDAEALYNRFTIGVGYKMKKDTIFPSNPDEPGNEDVVPPSNPDEPSDEDIVLSIGTDDSVDGDSSDKLPQTGGIINSASLIALGAIAIGTGIVLNKKSEDKGGDKHNE